MKLIATSLCTLVLIAYSQLAKAQVLTLDELTNTSNYSTQTNLDVFMDKKNFTFERTRGGNDFTTYVFLSKTTYSATSDSTHKAPNTTRWNLWKDGSVQISFETLVEPVYQKLLKDLESHGYKPVDKTQKIQHKIWDQVKYSSVRYPKLPVMTYISKVGALEAAKGYTAYTIYVSPKP